MCVCMVVYSIWRGGDCGVVYLYKSIHILYKYISAVLRLIACNRKSQSNSINGKLNQSLNFLCPIVLMFVFCLWKALNLESFILRISAQQLCICQNFPSHNLISLVDAECRLSSKYSDLRLEQISL